MATLTSAEYNTLKYASRRRADVRFWLFDEIALIQPDSYPACSVSMSTTLKPAALISPPYALLRPGESVVLYGGDSYERGGTPATGHAWALVSGSAILSPAGNECTVTPTGGEDSEVVVSLTVTATNSQTAVRYAYIACSTEGWCKPTGTLTLDGSIKGGEWSGHLEITGDDAEGLTIGGTLLVHVDTYFDGVKQNIGGYKRAENMCLLRVGEHHYYEDSDGHMRASVPLLSPSTTLGRSYFYCAAANIDGKARMFYFDKTTETWETTYLSDFRATDALLYIAVMSQLAEEYNVTVFHEDNEYDNLYVEVEAPIWNQLRDLAESLFCWCYVNYTGSVMIVPNRHVRGSEWWGTPTPVWDDAADGPLDASFKVSYEPQYHEEKYPGLHLSGYDANQDDVWVSVKADWNVAGQEFGFEDIEGYVLPSYAIGETWATNYLAHLNRDWDVPITFLNIGNALQLGSHCDLDLPPKQTGQTAISGSGIVTDIKHTFELGSRKQTTVAHFEQVLS